MAKCLSKVSATIMKTEPHMETCAKMSMWAEKEMPSGKKERTKQVENRI